MDRQGQTERRTRAALALQLFAKRYGRKAQRGGRDSNDRCYDRKVERRAKRLPPTELDALLRDGDEGA